MFARIDLLIALYVLLMREQIAWALVDFKVVIDKCPPGFEKISNGCYSFSNWTSVTGLSQIEADKKCAEYSNTTTAAFKTYYVSNSQNPIDDFLNKNYTNDYFFRSERFEKNRFRRSIPSRKGPCVPNPGNVCAPANHHRRRVGKSKQRPNAKTNLSKMLTPFILRHGFFTRGPWNPKGFVKMV